jgi:beta-glucosidase
MTSMPESAPGIHSRAREIVAGLSDDEKVRLLSGLDMWHLEPVGDAGIPAVRMADGPHGLRREVEGEDTPGLGPSTPATCFPTSATLACSWDTELVEEVGRALGSEARAQGVGVVLGPGLNLKRHPCCGRNFEYYSEDPLLAGTMAAALVRGIQSAGVGACLKHFAVNNQETHRMTVDAIVDERTLRELYLYGFEIAVRESAPWAVMCAYNRINGVYCSDNAHLLTGVLRDEWGFEGLVMSDWGATNDRVAGVAAGLDLEMPSSNGASDKLVLDAVASGSLPRSALDTAATRVVELALRAMQAGQAEGIALDPDSHHELARRAAAESTVLLTNDGILPLAPSGRIAVIGAFAEAPRFQGTGSSRVTPTAVDAALSALRERIEESASLTYARGYDAHSGESDDAMTASAVRTAEVADVVVLFAGLPETHESEGIDREHMRLPAGHERLIEAVCAANPRTVVVLSNGAPVELSWAESPAAIVETYLGGQASGSAIVDVLIGDRDPGGRLAETFPVLQGDVLADAHFPGVARQVEYREGLYVGYRYFTTADVAVRFPFGHGLSYTTFEFGRPRLSAERIAVGDVVEVRVRVANTGDRSGSTVVQIYVRDVEATVDRPMMELAGFAKVHLDAGESTDVAVVLDRNAFAFFDVGSHKWQVEGGEFEVLVGESVAGTRGTTTLFIDSDFTPAADTRPRAHSARNREFSVMLGRPVPFPEPRLPFTRTSAVEDLEQTRLGRRVLSRLLSTASRRTAGAHDRATEALLERVVLEMPLRNLVTMSGGALSWRTLDALIDALNGRYGSALRRLMSR